VPVLAGPRSVADLPGGLTNHNLRVTTRTGDYVVRLTQSDAGLLGIDRDAEHANTRSAAEAGVGAHVVDYRPDLGMLVITFLPGKALTNESIGAPGVIARAADAIRRLHAGPRFTGDFDMFTRQAGEKGAGGIPMNWSAGFQHGAIGAKQHAVLEAGAPSQKCTMVSLSLTLSAAFVDWGTDESLRQKFSTKGHPVRTDRLR